MMIIFWYKKCNVKDKNDRQTFLTVYTRVEIFWTTSKFKILPSRTLRTSTRYEKEVTWKERQSSERDRRSE